jgi:hypothetical protein
MVNIMIVMGLSAVCVVQAVLVRRRPSSPAADPARPPVACRSDHTLALHLLHPNIAHATSKPPTTFPFFGRPIWSLVSVPAEGYPVLSQDDLQQAVGLLEKKSRSFWVASAGFGAEVREKLVALCVALFP